MDIFLIWWCCLDGVNNINDKCCADMMCIIQKVFKNHRFTPPLIYNSQELQRKKQTKKHSLNQEQIISFKKPTLELNWALLGKTPNIDCVV